VLESACGLMSAELGWNETRKGAEIESLGPIFKTLRAPA
jgi:hypothetical protein